MRINKKTVFIILLNIIIVVVIVIIFGIREKQIKNIYEEVYEERYKDSEIIGEFMLNDYQKELKNFSSNKTIKNVDNLSEMKKEVEDILIDSYGDVARENKPYRVYYDKDNNAWLFTGTYSTFVNNNWFESKYTYIELGALHYAIVDGQSGKVLAIWGEM